MAFGIGLPDVLEDPLNKVPGLGSVIETDAEKKRRKKRQQDWERKHPKAPKNLPEWAQKQVEHQLKTGEKPKSLFQTLTGPAPKWETNLLKSGLKPGATLRIGQKALDKIGAPGILGNAAGDLAAVGEGFLPAALMFGKAAKHQVFHPHPIWEANHQDVQDFKALARWTYDEAKRGHDPKHGMPPQTDDELSNMVAMMLGSWGRSVAKAVPTPWHPSDWREAAHYWNEHPVQAAMDVWPIGAALTRPLSIGSLATRMGRMNPELSRLAAVKAGVRESYYPGAGARRTVPAEGPVTEAGAGARASAPLGGGIGPRIHTFTEGDNTVSVQGRPWSRTPLARGGQRATDEAYKLFPGAQRKRVGAHQNRLAGEQARRIDLETAELSAPIARVVYGRMGNLIHAFGHRADMTPMQRRRATALSYVFQNDRHLDPITALQAVEDDLSNIHDQGFFEMTPKGKKKMREIPLTASERESLQGQIMDLKTVRGELERGEIHNDEFTAALEAMKSIADKTFDDGLEIMRRHYNFSEEQVQALAETWKRRGSILPRRLQGRGLLGGELQGSVERSQLYEHWIESGMSAEEAQARLAITDSVARAVRADDPAGFYRDRVGEHLGETAEEFMVRRDSTGADALYQARREGIPIPEDTSQWERWGDDVELLPLEDLRTLRDSADTVDEAKVRKLMDSISEEGGVLEPLIIDFGVENNGAYLSEGNNRFEALDRLGYTEAPARVITVRAVNQERHGGITMENPPEYIDEFGDAHPHPPQYTSPSSVGFESARGWREAVDQASDPATARPKPLYQKVARTAHNTRHRTLITRLEQAEKTWDQVKKDHPERDANGKKIPENKAIREEAKAHLDAAMEDELYARIRYGSKAWANRSSAVANPGRARLAKRLFEHRKDRRGALPPGIKNPKELEWLMSLLDELTKDGEHARFWYENSADSIKELAGGNKKRAMQIAQLVAIYSPQKAVIPNLGEAFKAWNSYHFGKGIDNGQDWQIAAAKDVMEGKGNWDGRKTNNFFLNFYEDIDPAGYRRFLKEEGLPGNGVTSDMWMARVFGYLQKNVSEGRYDVIEQIVQHLAEERGWKPKQVQAAIWTAIKEKSDDVSANVDFMDAAERHIGVVNSEGAPSVHSGPFADEFAAMAPETQAAYTRGLNRLIDDFLRDSGILHVAGQEGAGAAGPGLQHRVLSPGAARKPTKAERAKEIAEAAARGEEPPPEVVEYTVRPADRNMYRYVAAAIGRAGLQDSVPWMRGFVPTTGGHADTVFVGLGRAATREEMVALWNRLNPDGIERVQVIHAGNDGVIMRLPPEATPLSREAWLKRNNSFQGETKAAVADTLPNAEQQILHVSDGEEITNDWTRGAEDYDRAISDSLGDAGGSGADIRLREHADRLHLQAEALRDEFRADGDAATLRYTRRRSRGARELANRRAGAAGLTATRTLLQRPRFSDLPRGAIEFLDEARTRSRIHEFKGANASTWIHELGHSAYWDLSDADKAILNEYYAAGKKGHLWEDGEHEAFAEDFEKFVKRGKAPNQAIESAFRKMSNWIRAVWKEEKRRAGQQGGTKMSDWPDELEGVFNRMFKEPDDADVWGYFPHRDITETGRGSYQGAVRTPARGGTLGKPSLDTKTITRGKNELVRYQTGRLGHDPIHLIDVFLKRLRFKETYEMRDESWQIGRSLADDPPPKGMSVYLVRNPDATPVRIEPQVRARAEGRPTTQEVDVDALEQMEEMLSQDWDSVRREMIARPGERPSWAVGADNEANVRWVPADYIKRRYGEVFETKPNSNMWSALSLATSLQRTTGIYGRPISYIGGNIPFNVLSLMSSMPMQTLRNFPRVIRMMREDPELYRMIVSEMGETRATGGLPKSYLSPEGKLQQAEETATRYQRGIADLLSKVADNPFRATAFLNGAGKRGVKTRADLHSLIRENGHDLSDIRQLGREQMLDFDALNPSQRRLAQSLLYLYPFIYASVKWPVMFAREYPARSALFGNLAMETGRQRGEPNEIANLWKKYGIDLATINPVGPMADIAQQSQQFFKDPTQMDLSVLQDRLSPTLAALVEGMSGGKKNALQNYIRGTIPGASELYAQDPAYRGNKVFADRSWWDYVLQRHLRFYPRGINHEVLNDRIEQYHSDMRDANTHDIERDQDWKKIANRYKVVGGDVDEIRRSYTAWWNYQEAVDEKKSSSGQRKLTSKQYAEILDEVVRDQFPDHVDELWDLSIMDSEYQKKYKKELADYVEYLKNDVINDARSQLQYDWSAHKRSSSDGSMGGFGGMGGMSGMSGLG